MTPLEKHLVAARTCLMRAHHNLSLWRLRGEPIEFIQAAERAYSVALEMVWDAQVALAEEQLPQKRKTA